MAHKSDYKSGDYSVNSSGKHEKEMKDMMKYKSTPMKKPIKSMKKMGM